MAEIGRHDADNGVTVFIHANAPAQNMRVAAELALPQPIADHHGLGETGRLIARPIKTSQSGLSAQDIEIIEAGAEHFDALGMIAAAKRGADWPDDADVVENAGSIAQILELRNGQADVLHARAAQIVKDSHQAFRMLEWKRAQEHGIDHGKDGDVRADAERQRKHRDRGESGSFQKSSPGKVGILHRLFQPQHRAFLALELFGLLHATVSAPGLNPRVFRRHAAAAEFVFE